MNCKFCSDKTTKSNEFCTSCLRLTSLSVKRIDKRKIKRLVSLEEVVVDLDTCEAFAKKSGFKLSNKKKFDFPCLACKTTYRAATLFERTKKHPWNCKSCAIKSEWSDPSYAKAHCDALKEAHNRPDAIENHRKAQIKKWEDPALRKKMTKSLRKLSQEDEWREKVSTGLLKRWAEDPPKCSFGTRHAGWYQKIDGSKCYLRSSYEHRVASVLDALGIVWQFEKKRYTLQLEEKKTVYIPDFYIPRLGILIEVKGHFYKDARVKWNQFLVQYSDLNICLIQKDDIEFIESLTNGADFEDYIKEKCRQASCI